MALLDKQEVQHICGHTVVCARKWSGFICKLRQKIINYDTIALCLLKKEEKEGQIATFYFAWCVCKTALYSDFIHSFDWKSP